MKQLTYILLTLLLITSCKSKNEVDFTMDPVTNIEALWQIIDTKYCYVEQKGVDWASIHDEYIAKAKNIGSDQMALFDLCAQMLDTLHDGHVNLYSPFDRSFNTAWYDSYPTNFDAELQKLYLKDYRIAGGLYYCTIANGTIGYIYYSSFSNDFSGTNLYWVFTTFQNCKGIVLDVRNNGGGDLNNAYRLAAPFMTENKIIGYWQHKEGPGHNDFSELEPLYSDTSLVGHRWLRPVIILANRRSYSATNFFINMMRYAGNHVAIIGGTSGGGGGMPMSYEMPCGWTVRFSSVRMYDADKKDIEQGIEPNLKINMTSTTQDDIIEKAIEIINNAYK